jgi:hypothetical protein
MLQSQRLIGTRTYRVSPITRLIALLVGAAGCGGNVVVGEAKDDAGSTAPTATGTADPTLVPDAGAPDCSEADKTSRTTYDAWTMQPNSFGSLVGKTFTGYLEGGPDLTLTIDTAGGATLIVGMPAPPPKANLGYLCGDGIQDGTQCQTRYNAPPVAGGVYSLHGASFAADRLLAPIQPNAPYDTWCALQTPRETDVCFFQPIGNEGFTITPSTGMCTLAGHAVDCGWMELAGLGVCSCSSHACFAATYTEASMRIDARLDEATHELTGSFLDGDRSRLPLYLSETSP